MARPKGLKADRHQVAFRLDSENDDWLRLRAMRDRKTMSQVINEVIGEYRKTRPLSIKEE